jgi:hypothetical protein
MQVDIADAAPPELVALQEEEGFGIGGRRNQLRRWGANGLGAR